MSGDVSSTDAGLAASATATNSFHLGFTVAYDTFVSVSFTTVTNSGAVGAIQKWDGSNWTNFLDATADFWSGGMTAGSYRYFVYDSLSVSGSAGDSFVHGFYFNASDPVPEPASILALSVGAVALFRKRRP